MKNKKGNKKEVQEELDTDQTIKHIFKTKEKDVFTVEYNNLSEELKSDNFLKIQPFILSNFIQSKITQLGQHQDFVKEYLNQPEAGEPKLKEHIDLEDFKAAKEIMLEKFDLNMKKCEDLIKEDLKKLTFLTKKQTKTNNSNNICFNGASSSSSSDSSSSSEDENEDEDGNENSLDSFIKKSIEQNIEDNQNNNYNYFNNQDCDGSKFDYKQECFFSKSQLNSNINNHNNNLMNLRINEKNFNNFSNNNKSDFIYYSNSADNNGALSLNKSSNGKPNNNNSSSFNQDSNKNTITVKDEEPPAVKIKLTYADGKDSFPQYLSILSTDFENFDEFLTVLKRKLGIYKYARFKLVCMVNGKESFYIISDQQLHFDRLNEIKLVPEDYEI